MKNVYTPLKAAFLILLVALSAPLSMHAQTFDVAANKYAVNGTINAIAKDNAGNTYMYRLWQKAHTS